VANPNHIVTPLAQNETSQATVCLPWFVDLAPEGPSEFHPLPASYRPLVNGEEAFGAVHDAIAGATHTVDIICWGFQPSMYFKRGVAGAPCIGDLLIEKATEGVKVRLLCWLDNALVAQISEASMPEYGTRVSLRKTKRIRSGPTIGNGIGVRSFHGRTDRAEAVLPRAALPSTHRPSIRLRF
jgi:hypothetical protein